MLDRVIHGGRAVQSNRTIRHDNEAENSSEEIGPHGVALDVSRALR
jgi:hypothetical protein